MTTTEAEAIKYAIAQGLKTVNLSPGKVVSNPLESTLNLNMRRWRR